MVRETGRHGRCARPIPAWGLLSPPRLRPIQLELQRQVGTAEMVIGSPPFEMGEQFAGELCRGPGATGQSRQTPPQAA
jgi:hypothetical protein